MRWWVDDAFLFIWSYLLPHDHVAVDQQVATARVEDILRMETVP